MKIIKNGGHRLFENDPKTAQVVSEILLDLEKNGLGAVRKYSEKFDEWNPESFELGQRQIEKIIDTLPEQLVHDADYCQGNVRRFAEAQLKTLLPLEVEIHSGVVLGYNIHPKIKTILFNILREYQFC
jgi:sulfopropanediol 3-dehydrogenase